MSVGFIVKDFFFQEECYSQSFFYPLKYSWLTRDFKSQGRLSIGSSGHKNLFLSVGLEGSTLDSKGGIVGGSIELSQIDTCSKYYNNF